MSSEPVNGPIEQLPSEEEIQYGVVARTLKYFPKQWAEACEVDI